MSNEPTPPRAELIVPSTDLPADMAFFTNLGFRLDQILPADNPTVARLSGHGLHLCIDRNADCEPPTIRFAIDAAPDGQHQQLQAPSGANGRFWGTYRDAANPRKLSF